MNMFNPDGAPAEDPSPRSTPVTSPSHSAPTSTSPPPSDATVTATNSSHQLVDDDFLDLKIEVEAEEKLKKAHEEAAKILPVLYVDGTAEEQDTGITLADIRVTYPGCYLKEFQGTGVYRNGGFVLENGKGYTLIRPTAHDKLTEEEAADVKSSHHDDDHEHEHEHGDHSHDNNSNHHDHLYDREDNTPNSAGSHSSHDHSPGSSPPMSPSASPMVSPAPTQRNTVSGAASAPARTGSPPPPHHPQQHDVVAGAGGGGATHHAHHGEHAAAAATNSGGGVHVNSATAPPSTLANALHTTATTATNTTESRTKTPPTSHPTQPAVAIASASGVAPRAASPPKSHHSPTKDKDDATQAAVTSPPPAATIGHTAVPPVSHKDPSTHADGSHSLTDIFAVPHAPHKEHKAADAEHDDADHDDDEQPNAEDSRVIALSAIEEQYGDGTKKNYASLRAKRQVGTNMSRVLRGSIRGPGKSVTDRQTEDSPQSSPEIGHGALKKQPSSPALQAPAKLANKGSAGGVRFSESSSGHSPPMQSATMGGSRKPHNYAYEQTSKKDKKRQQALRKRTRVAASWEANEILPGLWLGDKCDSMERTAMKDKGITNVFTVACDLPPPFPEDFEYKVLDLLDSSSQNIIQYFPDAIRYISANISNGRQTLVHCQQGVSRSATVVIAFVMYSQRMDFDTAGEHVCSRRNRVCPNFGFMQQLKQWGETLQREWAAESLAKAKGLPPPPSIIYSTSTLAPETLTLNVPLVASSTSASLSVNTSSASSSRSPSPPASPTHGLSTSGSTAANNLASMFITPKHSDSVSSSSSSAPHGSPAPALKHFEKNHTVAEESSGDTGISVHIIPPDKTVSVS